MDNLTEYQIIDEVLKGRTEQFSLLIAEYKDMVYTLSLKLLKNVEEAEEHAQDAFLQAFRKLSQFDKRSKFSTWLYTITYRLGINKLKKKKIAVEELSDNHMNVSNDTPDSLDLMVEKEAKKALLDKIKLLDPESQYLLQVYYFEEMSIKEVATVMAISETNVKSKLFRIRKKLKEILKVRA